MDISIRQLQESELSTADHIFRLAFGTFIGLPNPLVFGGDANYIQPRWFTDPTAAFAAEVEGKLVGSICAVNWGSFGSFGPLSVHPDLWNQGVGQRLVEAVMERFNQWGIQHAGLFTFPNSPKHLGLYQKFGFCPRFLTAIMCQSVYSTEQLLQGSRYSQIPEHERAKCLECSRELTGALLPGLDLSREIRAVDAQKLGDTLLLWDDQGLAGLAVCHIGAGSEAGSDTCYVKFGAVRPGPSAGQLFEQLLDSCQTLSAMQGMSRLVAGVNTSRHEAYRRMLARGFRIEILGLVMQKPNESGYNRPEIYALDDWR